MSSIIACLHQDINFNDQRRLASISAEVAAPDFLNDFSCLLFVAKIGLHTPAKRSSHSSSSWLSKSILSSQLASSLLCRRLVGGGCRSLFSQLEEEHIIFVSRMYFPTLYLCDSSSAPSYFQPRIELQKAHRTSLTVCNPVTSCLDDGASVLVFGKHRPLAALNPWVDPDSTEEGEIK